MAIVLTVDRSRVVRAVIERHLERYDCVAIEATTADEAIAAAREHAPVLMLVEAGAHAVAARREDEDYDAVPIVLLVTDHPAAARFDDDPRVLVTLRKPFDQSAFDGAVRRVLGAPRAATAAPRPGAQLGALR